MDNHIDSILNNLICMKILSFIKFTYFFQYYFKNYIGTQFLMNPMLVTYFYIINRNDNMKTSSHIYCLPIP